MPSTFTRLFRYAKGVGADAKENYTTEVLRAAIETDARPLRDALKAGVRIDVASTSVVSVETQFAIATAGIVDMVLSFVDADLRRTVWIEVKVDAGESGDQLANYARFISSLPEGHRPTLIVLGPKLLRDGVPLLKWQVVRDAIVRSGTASPYWLDLKTYLEEIRMADNYDEPVTGVEAQALAPARNLVGKLARILTPFALEADAVWRGAGWPPTESKVVDTLLQKFEEKGTLTIANDAGRHAGLSAGLYHDPATGDAWLGLWIWMNPRKVAERRALLDMAPPLSALGDEWHRDEAEWELLGAYRRLVEISTHAEGTSWLRAKLVQLRDAGLLDLVARD
jgi:hypothetical protein